MNQKYLTPNFIGIGPGKCGTTWLYNALSAHPQVLTSTSKETLYFSDYYSKGMKWYQGFFPYKAKPETPAPIAIGEVSNTYIFDPAVAARIAEALPGAKIIYNLRDPLERAFSHYLFMLRNAMLKGSFEEAIQQRPDLLARGKYAEHLKSYHQHFAASQRLCLFYDDLKSDPVGYANSIWDFLGVDGSLYEADPAKRVLEAATSRNRLLARGVVAAAALTRRLGHPEIVSKVKQSGFAKLVFRPFAPGEAPKIDLETRERLKPYYYSDLDNLSEMTGRDLRTIWGY